MIISILMENLKPPENTSRHHPLNKTQSLHLTKVLAYPLRMKSLSL